MISVWRKRLNSAAQVLSALALLWTVLKLPAGPVLPGVRAEPQNTLLPLAFRLASPQDILTLQPLFRRYLLLDGNDDFAWAPDSSDLDLGRGSSQDFTIETFFYIGASTPLGTQTLVEREQFSLKIVLTSGTADSIQFRVQFEAAEWRLFPVLSLTNGWHHLAIVFRNDLSPGMDQASIYLDGTLQAFRTGTDPGPVLNSSGPLFVGSAESAPFGGRVEELRLSATARYTGHSFEPPTAYFEPDEFTRALWHFDDYPGSTVFTDSSGRENLLTGQRGAMTMEPGN